MSSVVYDISVPVIAAALKQQLVILKKAQAWAKENNVDEKTLTEGRIADDMLPLTFQIQTCSNNAKGILTRAGGQEIGAWEDNEKTFEELCARVEKTLDVYKAATPEKFMKPDEIAHIKITPKLEFKAKAIEYLQGFALPNFFFHHATMYNILRKAGVPLGKRDFIDFSPFIPS